MFDLDHLVADLLHLQFGTLRFIFGNCRLRVQFNSRATSTISKFCRGPSVWRWRFIFRGWKFSVRSGLCFDFFYRGALTILITLIAIFTLAITAAKFRGLDITCGCFGHASQHWSFPSHLATNLAILAGFLRLDFASVEETFVGRALCLPVLIRDRAVPLQFNARGFRASCEYLVALQAQYCATCIVLKESL